MAASSSSEHCSSAAYSTEEECANQLLSVTTAFVAVANNSTSSPAVSAVKAHIEEIVTLSPSTNNHFFDAVPIMTNFKSLPNHVRSDSSGNIQRIGNGNEQFEVKVCIEKCHDLCSLLPSRGKNSTSTPGDDNVWLSYRFINTVAQSDILSTEATLCFPMMHTFRIQSSFTELVHYFHVKKNSSLKVHVCTEGEILGTANIDMRQLIVAPNQGEEFRVNAVGLEGRMIHYEYSVIPKDSSDSMKRNEDEGRSRLCTPRLTVRLCIDRDPTSIDADRIATPRKNMRHNSTAAADDDAAVSLSTSSQTTKTVCVDRASSPRYSNDKFSIDHLEKKADQLNSKESELSNKEKEILQEVASLERQRCEWEKWRHREELEWQEKLRQKESVMLKGVEERLQSIERERISALELSKNEYDKLETRLRKALIDVEAKERQLKHVEVSHKNEQKSKLAELELREKLMKEELKHSIEIERAKVSAAVGQAVAAQTVASAATKKANQLEIQIDQLREQHRATPEVSLLHQVAELKGHLADCERRIEALKGEKNAVIAEKEQFRANVHKLARALRQERERSVSKKREFNNQQVCLSYDKHENSFALSGDQDEIHRILTDLSKISQGATPPIKICSRTSSSRASNNAPPMPSTPPVYPMSTQQHLPQAVSQDIEPTLRTTETISGGR